MFNFYGSNEVGRIAQECPVHDGLHVNADQVIVETVPRQPGGPNEVIVTSLAAGVSPFLRFRLDDLGESIERRCACGSSFPLMAAPEGRHWDLIRLPSGRAVSPMVCAVVLRRAGAIDQYRLVQHARHRFVLELVPGAGFRDDALREIEAGLRSALGEPVTIDVRRVDSLATPVGKYRVFESRLDEAS
jgi:phenylacetate-CoA ligase